MLGMQVGVGELNGVMDYLKDSLIVDGSDWVGDVLCGRGGVELVNLSVETLPGTGFNCVMVKYKAPRAGAQWDAMPVQTEREVDEMAYLIRQVISGRQ